MEVIKNISAEHWMALLFALVALVEVIVRITPTDKDNTILEKIKSFLNVFIPNNKKGGGNFK